MTQRTGGIDLPTLEQLVADGTIDTVVVAFADLQGRLLGKRVVGRFFLDHVVGPTGRDEPRDSGEGIEACDYLLTVDVDMNVARGLPVRVVGRRLRRLPRRPRPVDPVRHALARGDRAGAVRRGRRDDREPGRGVAPPDPAPPARPGGRARAHGHVRLRARVLRPQRHLRRAGRGRLPHAGRHARRRGSASTTTCSRRPRTSRCCGPSATACSARASRSSSPRARRRPASTSSTCATPTHCAMADNHTIYKNGAKEIADVARQGHHVHGQAPHRPARIELPHPHVDLVDRRRRPLSPSERRSPTS